MPHDTDNAWKAILRGHFRECLRFFFPAIHDAIDWSIQPVFLDKELDKLVSGARKGKALADKLVQVRLRGGKRIVVFLHVEIQGWRDPTFAARMFRYNVLIRERYGDDVVSVAVLTDSGPGYRPLAFEYELLGFSLRMQFPVVKLLDYRGRKKELASSPSPFALVVLAHLERFESRALRDAYRAKRRLVRLLFQRGHTRQEVHDLLRFLDWILRLPEGLEVRIMKLTRDLERRKTMPFLSNLERWSLRKGLRKGRREGLKEGRAEGREEGRQEGKQQGMAEGLHEAIAIGLEHRFGARGLALLPRVRKIHTAARLRELLRRLQTARSLTAFRDALGKG